MGQVFQQESKANLGKALDVTTKNRLAPIQTQFDKPTEKQKRDKFIFRFYITFLVITMLFRPDDFPLACPLIQQEEIETDRPLVVP